MLCHQPVSAWLAQDIWTRARFYKATGQPAVQGTFINATPFMSPGVTVCVVQETFLQAIFGQATMIVSTRDVLKIITKSTS